MTSTNGGSPQRRKQRDRERTEADLLEATFELLQRDGIFAGLNLQEVADRAGANRGQIYQYFGDRRSLLRTAVAYRAREWAARATRHFDLPFFQRRRAMFRNGLADPGLAMVEALLAVDGDPDYHPLPEIDRTRIALQRDLDNGDLPADADAVAMHAFTVAAYKGYLIFRTGLARDTGIPLEQLDARVLAVYDRMLEAMVKG